MSEPYDGITIAGRVFQYPEFHSTEHAATVVRCIRRIDAARIWRDHIADRPAMTKHDQFELAELIMGADLEPGASPILLAAMLIEDSRDWSLKWAAEVSTLFRSAKGHREKLMLYAAYPLGLMNVSEDRHAIARLASLGGESVNPDDLLFEIA